MRKTVTNSGRKQFPIGKCDYLRINAANNNYNLQEMSRSKKASGEKTTAAAAQIEK